MKKRFLLSLLVSLILLVLLVLSTGSPVFAQEATATPRPTFGPTCSPTPPVVLTATPTPTLPVTAGSAIFAPFVLALGTILVLGSLGTHFLLSSSKTNQL